MRFEQKLGMAFAVAATVAACGGGDSGGTPPANQSTAAVSVPGLASTANFSFDLGTVVNGKYYLTDRNSKAIDVIDVNTLAITQIKGTGANAFTGVGPATATSGPNGINAITMSR